MNAIKCLTCNTTIESTHRHDYKSCDCAEGSGTRVFVDGGSDYERRGFEGKAVWIELGDGKEWSAADFAPPDLRPETYLKPDIDLRGKPGDVRFGCPICQWGVTLTPDAANKWTMDGRIVPRCRLDAVDLIQTVI